MDIRRRSLLSETLHEGGSSEGAINIDNYLTIEALEDGLTASLSTNACEYCVDGDDNWKTLAAGAATESINSGHTLSFRGELVPSTEYPNCLNGIGTFTISKKCNLKGNCMSMRFGDNATDNYSLNGKNYAFSVLFKNCTNIVNVSSNFLPATTLAQYCYHNMFSDCTNLTTAPTLPATTLAENCYYGMFVNCISLTTAPELPATTLKSNCYIHMFNGCTNLTTAPTVLPATKLLSSCYQHMFSGCTNLTTAPVLPATTLAGSCYNNMFRNCSKLNYIKMLATNISASRCLNYWVYRVASTGTFVKNSAMTTLPTGQHGIPSGWTVVNDGEESGGLLEFTVDGVVYQFEDGMTWADWCDSSYNTGGFKFYLADSGWAVYTSDYKKYFKNNMNPTALVEAGVYETNKVDWPMPKG